MELLKAVLEESEAFRSAYAAAVPEKKKTRSILKEAASEDSQKNFYDVNSSEFKEALKQIPNEVIDLIYSQLKIEPHRLVEIDEKDSDDSFVLVDNIDSVENAEEYIVDNDDD